MRVFFHVPESDCSKIRGWCARERFSADGAGAPRVCLVGSENVYDTADVIEGVSGSLDVSESVPSKTLGVRNMTAGRVPLKGRVASSSADATAGESE